MSNLSHADLVKLAARWLRNHRKCSVVITELTSNSRETPDAIGFNGINSWLIECKTSQSDFKADRMKHFRRFDLDAMGRQRYFLAPIGLIQCDGLPEGWGLLETDGKEVIEVVQAIFRDNLTRQYEIELLISALRRVCCQPKVEGVMVKVYNSSNQSETAKAAIYV